MNMDSKVFQTGENKIKQIFFNANVLGCGVIELRWNKRIPYPTSVYGFFVPDMRDTNEGTSELPNYMNSKWIDDKVEFFPAQENICWGYIYDTDDNRDRLARLLSTNLFSVSNRSTFEEIKKYAEEHNISLEIPKQQELGVKKTEREQTYEKQLVKKEMEIATLQQKLELLKIQEKNIVKDLADQKDRDNKPLKGVKIDKSKLNKGDNNAD